MATISRTVCDRHMNDDELVETVVPTVRITVSGAHREHRRDIEEELCLECVEELLQVLDPFLAAGRRAGKSSAVAPPPATPPAAVPSEPEHRPGMRKAPPGDPVPEGTLDDRGFPITNAGKYTCGAPGQEHCKRHEIGFNTKQARGAHERGSHKFNRAQDPGATTPNEGVLAVA